MTQVAPEIIALEQTMASAGLALADVLSRSGVSITTWWRWKTGATEPRLATIRRIRNAVQDLTDVAALVKREAA